MTITPERLADIEARAAKATEGPWETDATENEGNYGSGDDCVSGFSSYEVTSPSGRICDTLNSDVAMVYEEYDEFGCTAFDEVGMANMEFIAASRQDVPALVAEVRRLKEAQQWQPIETAPKDGQYILAYPCLAGIPLVITWGRVEDYPWSESWRVPLSNKAPPYRPTHWQPLPKPPVQS